MFAVNAGLSVVFVSVLSLQVAGVCRWQAGEVGRCVPLGECTQDAPGQEAGPLQKCRRMHWDGVCCRSTANHTETFVTDNEKSVYDIYSEAITKSKALNRSSRDVNTKEVNTSDGIIFRNTHVDNKYEAPYRNAKIKYDEEDSQNGNSESSKQTENAYKIVYSNDSEDNAFLKRNKIIIANMQNDFKIRRTSRQLNSREAYDRTSDGDGYGNGNQRQNENNNDHITYEDGNFNGDRDTTRHTNSFRENNSQRSDTNQRRTELANSRYTTEGQTFTRRSQGSSNTKLKPIDGRPDVNVNLQRSNKKERRTEVANSGYTTERQTFTRRPSSNTKLKPIDDRPDINVYSDIDYSVRRTTPRSITSRTVSANSNRVNREEDDSFVFDNGDTRGGGGVQIGSRSGGRPEVVMGPDDRDATEEEKESSFAIVKKMCEQYSRSVTQQISATPLLPEPQVVTISVSKCHLDSNPLIVGGELAQFNQFPHMAAVGWPAVQGDSYEWLCGGSLVSKNFVLTAAHCTYQDRDDTVMSGPPTVVHLGSNSLDGSEAQRIHIQRIYRHPGYKIPLSYHDIALLKLATPVVLSDAVRPACLGSAPQSGEKVVAAGWGLTGFGGTGTRELRTVELSVWDEAGCRRAFGRTRRFPHGPDQTQVCAGHAQGGRDTCQGDSGGPLQVQSKDNRCIAYIVGVTSLGRACGLEQSPAVYSRVSQHIRFITQVVWPHL